MTTLSPSTTGAVEGEQTVTMPAVFVESKYIYIYLWAKERCPACLNCQFLQ
jgi:hypothetical protein